MYNFSQKQMLQIIPTITYIPQVIFVKHFTTVRVFSLLPIYYF